MESLKLGLSSLIYLDFHIMDKEQLKAKKLQLEKQLHDFTQKYGFTTSKEKQQRVIEIGKELERVTKLLNDNSN